MNFTEYTLEQLIALQDKIDYEIDRRKEDLKNKAEEELVDLLHQVNEIQEKYAFIISAYDENAGERRYWVSSFEIQRN